MYRKHFLQWKVAVLYFFYFSIPKDSLLTILSQTVKMFFVFFPNCEKSLFHQGFAFFLCVLIWRKIIAGNIYCCEQNGFTLTLIFINVFFFIYPTVVFKLHSGKKKQLQQQKHIYPHFNLYFISSKFQLHPTPKKPKMFSLVVF